jgi:hypothetical protein
MYKLGSHLIDFHGIRVFLENLSRKFKFHYNLTRIKGTLHEDLRTGAGKVFVGTLEGKNHLEDLGVDGRIIFKWILKKWDGKTWT